MQNGLYRRRSIGNVGFATLRKVRSDRKFSTILGFAVVLVSCKDRHFGLDFERRSSELSNSLVSQLGFQLKVCVIK